MKNANHHLFYGQPQANETLLLDTNETHHARAVLRLAPGHTLIATNGSGTLFSCVVENFSKTEALCRILSKEEVPAPKNPLWFFIGLPDKNCFESALEGLVPLGASRIVPLECEYCQKGWWKESWEKQSRRFQEKIVTAAKQSRNPWFSVLDTPQIFSQALDALQANTILVADETGQMLDKIIAKNSGPIASFIGPPGGFSPRELTQLKSKNAQLIKLGSYRLRTELAAITLAAQLALIYG